MRVFFLSIALFTIYHLPFTPVAHAETVDLGFLGQDSIFFSTNELIAGTRARVYARIHNFGDVDVTGRVAFHQGTIPLGSSQPISVRANGAFEEVFVDFTVPDSDFNIRAEIIDADPPDTVTSNNIVLSAVLEPTPDEDQDGIEDAVDNCPLDANEDQRDIDADGVGDNCDEDDDNDVLSDEVETEMGSDPESVDTDGDGLQDAEDPNPTELEETEVTKGTEGTEDMEEVLESPTIAYVTSVPSVSSVPSETVPDTVETTTLSESSFDLERGGWNSYTFITPQDTPADTTILWNFGDGSTSSKSVVEHLFRESGSYEVSLLISKAGETIFEETQTVSVSFFHFENPSVKLVISILLVMLVIGLSIVFRLRKMVEARL